MRKFITFIVVVTSCRQANRHHYSSSILF